MSAVGGAAGLAHRLHRLGWPRHRVDPRGRVVRRWRYTLQAAKQVDGKAWIVEPLIDPPPETWLAEHLKAGDRLGFDPWLHTSSAAERLAVGCAKAGAELVAVDSNPLDAIWTERPQPPLAPVAVHGARFAGEAEADKLRRIRLEIDRRGVDAVVLSDSHAVAWTFNIRGADVAHTPLPLSYALVRGTAGRRCSSIIASCRTRRATISSNRPMSRSQTR